MINVRVKPGGEFVFTGDITKDPADVVDLIVDYTQYFKTDTITSVTVVGTNVTIDSSAVASNIVTIFISGGTTSLETTHRLRNAKVKITVSSATRTLERTVIVKVMNK